MKSSVLERNVRALLRHSYVPALPAPLFRDRLEALLLAEVVRRASSPVVSSGHPKRPTVPARAGTGWTARRATGVLVALAAALAGLLFSWRAFAPSPEATPEGRAGLLQRGAVALRAAAGPWRAAAANELALGLDYAGPSLLVATPGGLEFPVRAAGGELRVFENSDVELQGDSSAPRAQLRQGRATWRFGAQEEPLAIGSPLALAPPVAGPSSGALDGASTSLAEGRRREEVYPGPFLSAGTAQPRMLAGRVFDAVSHAPVTRFTVGLLGPRVETSPTAAVTRAFESPDGTFVWPDAPRGQQRLFVHAPDFALAQLGEQTLPPPAEGELAIALETGVALRGSVLDPEGNPVPDALVLSEGETPADSLMFRSPEAATWLPVLARTGADGRFRFAHLARGPHTLRVTAEGWAPTWMQLDLPGVPGAAEPVIRMSRGGAIAGRVTGEDGGPTAGALLLALPMDASQGQRRSHFDLTHSDADGSYRFEHLPAGSMIVVLTSLVATPEVKPVRVRESGVETVNFAPPQGGARLTGILAASDGRPMALQNLALVDLGAAQKANWTQNWVASTTDLTGRYLFEGVAPGIYQIYLIEEQGRGIRFVDELRVEEAPEITHDVRVGVGRLSVEVLGKNRQPEPAAILFLSRHTSDGWTFAGHGRSDASGRTEFAGMVSGTYSVEACPTRAGLGSVRRTDLVVSASSPEVTATIELTEGGPVSVLVLDHEGRPVENAQVSFLDELEIERTGSLMPFTDPAGRFRAFGLAPGAYVARARTDDGTRVQLSFQQLLGVEPELRLVLPPPLSPSPPSKNE